MTLVSLYSPSIGHRQPVLRTNGDIDSSCHLLDIFAIKVSRNRIIGRCALPLRLTLSIVIVCVLFFLWYEHVSCALRGTWIRSDSGCSGIVFIVTLGSSDTMSVTVTVLIMKGFCL